MAKRDWYRQIKDGQWYIASWTLQRDQCCDCGLVHDTEFKVEQGELMYRTKRNARATRDARKRLKKGDGK